MKKIAFTLLIACLSLGAGCSRPNADAPVVAGSPTPRSAAEVAERKKTIELTAKPVAPREEVVVPAPSSSPQP